MYYMLASTFRNKWNLHGINDYTIVQNDYTKVCDTSIPYEFFDMTLDHLVICILYDYKTVIDKVIYILFSSSVSELKSWHINLFILFYVLLLGLSFHEFIPK
jgi:hypothetical protein